MKKIIYLINPSDSHFLEKSGDRPPLSLACLSSYLKQFGHETRIIDLNHENFNWISEFENKEPDFVCFTVPTPNYTEVINTVKTWKFPYPNIKFIAGGNHVAGFPNEPKTLETFDYIVAGHGDGEQALLDIVEGKAKEQIVKAPFIQDLDTLPLPNYDSLDMNKYNMQLDGQKAITISTGRGCFFNCFYCGSATIKKVRNHSPDYVIKHMKYLYEKYNFKAFYIVDDIFTNNFKRVEEICDKIIWQFDERLHLRVTTRANLLTQKLCYKMKKAGVDIISIGLESGSDKVLKAMNKNETLEQQKQGVEYCYKAGIKVKGFFIIGLPKETWEDVMMTINFAKELVQTKRLHYADAYILNPVPASPFWQTPEQFDVKPVYPKDNNWNNYYQIGKDSKIKVNIKHPYLSEEQLNKAIELFHEQVQVGGLTYE